jgi:hypothetical protein
MSQTSTLYDSFRTRLRSSLDHHRSWLWAFRKIRYVLVQGPWQPLVVRYHQLTSHNPPLAVDTGTLFPTLDVDGTAARLRRDAYSAGFQVPDEMVESIVAYARSTGARWIDGPHSTCPAIERIARDPAIVAVARDYLRAEPVLLETRMYWTLPFPDEHGRVFHTADGGMFHYDVADVKSMTVFLYLTDVDADSGPHVVIKGTQARRTPHQILRRMLDDTTAHQQYGGRIVTILGPRGTGWFEDITTYHKQAHGTKVRLLLSMTYSLQRRSRPARRDRPARPM